MPITDPNVIQLLGILAALGVIAGAVVAALWHLSDKGSRLWLAAYVLAQSVFWLVLIDLAFELPKILTEDLALSGSGGFARGLRVLAILTFVSLCAALFWWAREAAQVFTTLFVAALFIVGLFDLRFGQSWQHKKEMSNSEETASSGTGADKQIFIIADELIGVEGIDTTLPEGRKLRRRIDRFWQDHGFRVYRQAFSRYYLSSQSIPAMLNFDTSIDTPHPSEDTITSNAFFDRRAKSGTGISVYQTIHMNFCSHPAVRHCDIYRSHNPLMAFASPIDFESFVTYVFNRVFWKSYAAHYFRSLSGISIKMMPGWLEVYGFPEWIDAVAADIRNGPAVSTIFAHLLFPHAPYTRGAGCRANNKGATGYYLAEKHNLRGEALEETIKEFNSQYYVQALCFFEKISEFLDAVLSDPAFEDATVVISGDHGSRISRGVFIEHLDVRDLVYNHSAFFAVRAGRVEPGYDQRFVAIQDLVSVYLGGQQMAIAEPEKQLIFVESSTQSGMLTARLPRFAEMFP